MSNTIESVLVETRVFPPPERAAQGARIGSMDAYRALCQEVEQDFDGFWTRHARENLTWSKPFTQVLDESDAPFYRWFGDGELNVSANCLDVHLNNVNADKTAIIFERSEEHTSELQSLIRLSYAFFFLRKKRRPTRNKRTDKHLTERRLVRSRLPRGVPGSRKGLRRILDAPRPRKPDLVQALHTGARRIRRAVLSLVRRWRAQRIGQLPRCPPEQRQRRQNRHHLREIGRAHV